MDEVISLLSSDNGSGGDWVDEIVRENLQNRILILNDGIEDYILEEYILYILKWNKEDKHIPVEDRKKIKLYLNSKGGDSFSANMLIDVIMLSKTPIIGIAFDMVASAAYYILLACHERLAFPSSTILQHDGQISIASSAKKAKNIMDYMDEFDDRTKSFVLSRTNMSSEFYDETYDLEFYMGAEKAKELGVIHKIIGADCSLEEVW